MKGIKREYSVARTPQQNDVAERKNRTLIEAARTMLVDSKLPTTFWAEANIYASFDRKADEAFFVGTLWLASYERKWNHTVILMLIIMSESMNNEPVVAGNQTNSIAGTRELLLQSSLKRRQNFEQEVHPKTYRTTDPINLQGPKDS
ncbi:ribonuclease H-like domain-containing protein [Tanacetum coccineum]